jgi:hypothetical protein
MIIRRASLVLGLMYASFPLSLGLGELIWRVEGAGTTMRWMSAAAGMVFASVVLAYNQGFESGKRESPDPVAVADPVNR